MSTKNLRPHISYNIIYNLPFDLRDDKTTSLQRASQPRVRLNRWATVESVSDTKIRLKLTGSVPDGSKSIRNYKLKEGTLPNSFWSSLREHVTRNENLERIEESRRESIRVTWPAFEAYIAATGYKSDEWAEQRIKEGWRTSCTLYNKTNNGTSFTLSLDYKRRVIVNDIKISSKYLTPEVLAKIFKIIEEENKLPDAPPTVPMAKLNPTLFDDVWEVNDEE